MVGLGTIMAQMADRMTAGTPALASTAARKTASTETVALGANTRKPQHSP